jgi:hypothetical protein
MTPDEIFGVVLVCVVAGVPLVLAAWFIWGVELWDWLTSTPEQRKVWREIQSRGRRR